jgi:hypothetical protein
MFLNLSWQLPALNQNRSVQTWSLVDNSPDAAVLIQSLALAKQVFRHTLPTITLITHGCFPLLSTICL